jgi:hypothetical protein
MKNTTLSRKPSSTMKKNEGTGHEPRRNDQAGDGRDFAFNGQMGDGVNGHGTNGRYAGNQVGLTMRENFGNKTVRGNDSDCHTDRMTRIGPSATKDPEKMTIATAAQGHPVGKEHTARGFKNPDAINVGMK